MTKPPSKTITPVPDDNQSHKGPGSVPAVPLDTTKGHRDDEKKQHPRTGRARQPDAEHQQSRSG